MTYTLIARAELTGLQANITFSSIPATFTDLLLKLSVRNNSTAIGDSILVSFNGVTANFSSRALFGDGSSAGSFSQARWFGSANGGATTANTFNSVEIYIPNYRVSAPKSYSAEAVIENNGTTGIQYIGAGLWNDNAAITSISIANDTFNGATGFVSGSSATLYGITSGSNGGVVVS